MECVLIAMLQYVFKIEDSEPGSSAHQDTVNAFLNAAKFTKHDEHAEESLSFEDFRIWCTLLPSVRKFLGSLLISPDQGFLLNFLSFVQCIFNFMVLQSKCSLHFSLGESEI